MVEDPGQRGDLSKEKLAHEDEWRSAVTVRQMIDWDERDPRTPSPYEDIPLEWLPDEPGGEEPEEEPAHGG